jgi:hypothetical protein
LGEVLVMSLDCTGDRHVALELVCRNESWIHLVVTTACPVVDVVNGTLQVVFYRDDRPVVPAVHISAPPCLSRRKNP